MKFEIYYDKSKRDAPYRIRWEVDGKNGEAATEDLIWSSLWLPEFPNLTADQIATTIDNHEDIRKTISKPETTIPAIEAYLTAVEEARKSLDPILVENVNSITAHIDHLADTYPPKNSRRIIVPK